MIIYIPNSDGDIGDTAIWPHGDSPIQRPICAWFQWQEKIPQMKFQANLCSMRWFLLWMTNSFSMENDGRMMGRW